MQALTAAVDALRPARDPHPFDRDAEIRRLTALAAGLQGSVHSEAARIRIRSAGQETKGHLVKSPLAVDPVGDPFHRQPPPVRHEEINTVTRA